MNAKPWAIVGVLLLGVILGGYVVDATGQPIPIPGYQVPVDSLPPHPSQIVSVSAEATFSTSGQVVPVYSVPQDRWLVITEFRRSDASSSYLADLVQDYGGVVTLKLSHRFNVAFDSRTGLAFAPGSSVALRSVNGGASVAPFAFVGYLVR